MEQGIELHRKHFQRSWCRRTRQTSRHNMDPPAYWTVQRHTSFNKLPLSAWAITSLAGLTSHLSYFSGYRSLACCSVSSTSLAGDVFRASASLNTLRIVGWFIPRSMRLTKLRSTPAANASCSWVIFASFLAVRKTFPNATAGSKEISQYIGREFVEMDQSSLHNILVISKLCATTTSKKRLGTRNMRIEIKLVTQLPTVHLLRSITWDCRDS
jgi:hypothetical protein